MSAVYLTQEGLEKLEKELHFLKTQRRQEIAEVLRAVVESGELSENTEYEMIKNQQAFVEGRIQELEVLLAKAKIISKSSGEVIQIGSTITVQEEGLDPETYTLVGAAEANPKEGKISYESPLGKTLLNHRVGEIVSISAPDGSFSVKILKIE